MPLTVPAWDSLLQHLSHAVDIIMMPDTIMKLARFFLCQPTISASLDWIGRLNSFYRFFLDEYLTAHHPLIYLLPKWSRTTYNYASFVINVSYYMTSLPIYKSTMTLLSNNYIQLLRFCCEAFCQTTESAIKTQSVMPIPVKT